VSAGRRGTVRDHVAGERDDRDDRGGHELSMVLRAAEEARTDREGG